MIDTAKDIICYQEPCTTPWSEAPEEDELRQETTPVDEAGGNAGKEAL
jgi:hypothetical protein